MSDNNSNSTHIIKEVVLIVEGKDEELFFTAIIKDLLLKDSQEYQNLSKIQILPIGGKTKLAENLELLKISPNFSTVSRIGVTRDADDNPIGAFQSVQSALRNSGFPVPDYQFTLTHSTMRDYGTKTVGIMIIPKDRVGMLETFCFTSVEADKTIPCLNDFFKCLLELSQHEDYNLPTNLDKAKVHAFLSTRPEPDIRLGEAALKEYWKFNHPIFQDFITFLKLLTS